MRTSEYSIGDKQKISIATYYQWKKQMDLKQLENIKATKQEKMEDKSLVEENSTLRKLYINLSAHNYELAKFIK